MSQNEERARLSQASHDATRFAAAEATRTGCRKLSDPAFRVASQTIRGATEETLAGTHSVSAASTEPSNLADDAGTALEVVPLRDLWDEAYEALRGTHSKLVKQYEESIMRINQDNNHLAPNGSLARQEQLSAFITKRLDSIENDQTGFTMAGRKVVLHEQLDKFIRMSCLSRTSFLLPSMRSLTQRLPGLVSACFCL